MDEDKMLCECGEESTRGCHGIENGQVFSKHYCDKCYHGKNSLEDKVENEKEISNSV